MATPFWYLLILVWVRAAGGRQLVHGASAFLLKLPVMQKQDESVKAGEPAAPSLPYNELISLGLTRPSYFYISFSYSREVFWISQWLNIKESIETLQPPLE